MLEQRWICPNWDIFHFKSQYFSLHIYRSLKIGLLVLIWKQDPPKHQNMLIALNDGSSSLPTWLQGELPRRSSPVCLKVLPGNFTWGRRPVLNTGGAISYDRVTDWTKRAQQAGHSIYPSLLPDGEHNVTCCPSAHCHDVLCPSNHEPKQIFPSWVASGRVLIQVHKTNSKFLVICLPEVHMCLLEETDAWLLSGKTFILVEQHGLLKNKKSQQ